MILKETLRDVVRLQRIEIESADPGIRRDLLDEIDRASPQVVILSGIRRSGKSTLLRQIMQDLENFYYFKNQFECDFLVKQGEVITLAIQVCHELREDNLARELTGLQKAMEVTGAGQGLILTSRQEDVVQGIPVKPVWQWLLASGQEDDI